MVMSVTDFWPPLRPPRLFAPARPSGAPAVEVVWAAMAHVAASVGGASSASASASASVVFVVAVVVEKPPTGGVA